jgi:preprotein translocase subunit Sss1
MSEFMEFTLRDVVLIAMLTGVGFLLIGVVMTRIWRKDGVTGAMLFWAGSYAAAHPERYVKPQRVFVVKCVNVTGIGLFLVGVLIIVWATLQRQRL